MKVDGCLISYTKIKPRWVKDLNRKPETIELLEENMHSKILDISLGDDSLDLTPKTKARKTKINK